MLQRSCISFLCATENGQPLYCFCQQLFLCCKRVYRTESFRLISSLSLFTEPAIQSAELICYALANIVLLQEIKKE